jgi:FkbM family methyltransferase
MPPNLSVGRFCLYIPMKNLQGIFFRDFYNDHITEIFKEIFFEKLYDHLAVKDAVVVDVGANQGLFTFWASRFAKRIVSVEPSFEHFETLKHLIAFNKMTMVEPVKCAISNFTGRGTFYKLPNTTMFSLTPAMKTEDTEAVEVITLERLFNQYNLEHVDILKVDVEGEEFNIFSHSSFDAIAPKVKTIITEYHSWTNNNPVQLKNMLTDRGFKVTQLGTEATVLIAQK